MRRLLSLAACMLFVAACAPASALAQNSGVDEYQENPPNGGGGGGEQAGGGPAGAPLTVSPPPTVAGGGAPGDEGLGGFAEARGLGEKDREKGSALGPDRGGLGDALEDVAGGSGGLGLLLPIILAVTLAGAVLFVAARRRGGPHEA